MVEIICEATQADIFYGVNDGSIKYDGWGYCEEMLVLGVTLCVVDRCLVIVYWELYFL